VCACVHHAAYITYKLHAALVLVAKVMHCIQCCLVVKPLPPVGAGGGYMFSGRPSVPLSVRASVIRVVVLCFRDISSIC